MKVRMISYSQSNEYKDVESLVTYCARVSNPGNQMNTETNDKLVKYLIANGHWSPFEMCSICLEIETTRDIARQILRHRSFSFQEFSQRYAVADLGYELKDARLQDPTNRQSSIEADNDELKREWNDMQENVRSETDKAYRWALTNGIAKEQARAVLPEGMTLTRMYMNGTLRSWIHYIQMRSANGTQCEHRAVALECARVISTVFRIPIPSL
jgi:thymidylate synthase (FAD)